MFAVVWPDGGGGEQTRFYKPMTLIGDIDRIELEILGSGAFTGVAGIGCMTTDKNSL
jgi:hypothetical protein